MTDRHNPGSAAPLPGQPPGTASPRDGFTLWSKLFGTASPSRQRELLDLARHHGVLYAHQVPANGSHTAPADRGRILLANLLDTAAALEPVSPVSIEPIDAALDDCQREAVAKALATPDVCLIQGLPGTGKTRLVAELILQAVRCGERILLSANHAAALDGVLEQVASHDSIFAVRCLDGGEKAESLAGSIRPLAAAGRLRGLRDDGLALLRREADTLAQAAQSSTTQLAALERRGEVLTRLQELRLQLAEARQQREAVPAEVEAAAVQVESTGGDDSLARALLPLLETRRQAHARLDTALAAVQQQLADRRQTLATLDAERQPLQALAAARQSGHWWTADWWRSRFAAAALARLDGLNAEHEKMIAAANELADQQRQLLQEHAAANEQYQAERDKLLQAEATRRAAALETRLAELVAQERQATEQWQALGPPTPPEPDALREALVSARREHEQGRERAAFAREWLDCLSQRGEQLPGWLAAAVNLAAVPTAVVGSDPYFGEAALPGLAFDLAVVEEAQRLSEADFVKLARRARRLVLVADSEADNAKSARSQPTPTLFQRLWQRLHCDPRQLPYAWQAEQGRLCCRLRPCLAEQRQHLESERLADFPDIELRILSLPRATPALAEVIFPPSMSIAQAKEYIFRELQELPIQTRGHSCRWQEEPERWTLRLLDTPPVALVPVPLASGVRELVGPGDRDTYGIEFDRQAGWDRAHAEAWVRLHLGLRDLGRSIRLDKPYRMCPELAAVVADILYAGGYRQGPVGLANGAGVAVEFVAVPPADRPAGRKNGPRPPRGGAGLELDLADGRQRSRLPAEVAVGLPASGVVNFFEAQAVVRKLEALARGGRTSLGVLALYPAQATLIRLLANQSKLLATLQLPIGTPDTFRQREIAVMLVSLTRSHTNRAVPFGDSPAQLALALTRARCQLILFGDPGTLARRCQWDKAVDHLDEPTAAREREVVGRLCQYLQGKGAHARAFHLDEGIGP